MIDCFALNHLNHKDIWLQAVANCEVSQLKQFRLREIETHSWVLALPRKSTKTSGPTRRRNTQDIKNFVDPPPDIINKVLGL
jgi:hypothetical protein